MRRISRHAPPTRSWCWETREGAAPSSDQNSDAAPRASTLALRASLVQKVGRRYAGSVIVNESNRRFFEPAPGHSWMLGLNANYMF